MPGSTAGQRRPYRLLAEAMAEGGVAALGRFVRSGRESLCLVRARGDALLLETLFLAEDVYSQAEIDEAMDETKVKPAELDLARQVIDGLAGRFDAASLQSEYRRDLRALLEAKLRGEEIAEPEPVPTPAPAVDLMEALQASLAAAKTAAKKPSKPSGARKPARGAPKRRAKAS